MNALARGEYAYFAENAAFIVGFIYVFLCSFALLAMASKDRAKK